MAFLILSFLFLLSKLSALRKLGAHLVLRMVSIERLFCYVDLFNIGVDSVRLYTLQYLYLSQFQGRMFNFGSERDQPRTGS